MAKSKTHKQNAKGSHRWLQRCVRPQTFRDIHKIVSPTSEESEWYPEEKRAVSKLVNSGNIEVDTLLNAMSLEPKDWTSKRKKEISALMWPNAPELSHGK